MATRWNGFQQFFQTSPLVQRFLLPNAHPTGRQLGVGSYGSVEEVEINRLVCAGKKLHEVLLEAGNFGGDTIVAKYSDECQLMSDLRHPNIVQFLGLCFLPASPLPLLVMERLSTSLDDLLESSPNIPLSMKRSILADVSRGLVYLHTHIPPVIHRDLSARNVLLNSAMMAKISDLGNSRIIDLRPGQLARTLSRLPGTMVYMAPEAFQETSRYGTKLDMFSFGHLGLFTVTQVFPGDLLPSTYPDPENPERIIGVSEAERRIVYFEELQGQLGVGHPLEQLIRGCLQNAPSLRPSAEESLRQLEDMRALLQDPYVAMDKLEMVRTLQEKDREIQQLQTQGQQPTEANDHSRQQVEDLQQQMEQLHLSEETLRADLQTREAELREREAELQQRDADNSRLTIELRTAQQKEGLLQAGLQAREVELRERRAELQQRNADNSRLTKELRTTQTSLKTQTTELQLNISSHERTLASLQTDLHASEFLLREREGEAREREAEISRLLQESRSLQSQLHRLQEDAHQKNERLRQREEEIASPQRRLESGASKQLRGIPMGGGGEGERGATTANSLGGRGPCWLCDTPVDVKLEPCGHSPMCSECAVRARRCPTCKAPIKMVVKLIEICSMCKEEEVSVTLRPCSHQFCPGCSRRLMVCFECKAEIKQKEGLRGRGPCCLCDTPVDVKLEPCGHSPMCSECAVRARRCPTCKAPVKVVKLIEICSMCKEEEVSVTLRPCSHQFCPGCSRRLIVCFECKAEIKQKEGLLAYIPGQEEPNCPICLTEPRDTALTCGHQLCNMCSQRVDNCPICRKFIAHRIRLFQ